MSYLRKLLSLLGVMLFVFANGASAIELREEERAWLEQHPVIRYAPAPNYPPVEFFDETKRHLGITADFLSLILQKVELPIEIQRYDTWDEVMDATRQREVDMLGSVARTPERAQFLEFSPVYISLPTLIYMRHDSRYEEIELSQLIGKRVVVIESYASTEFLHQNYPLIDTITVPDIETGLRMVSYGMADAIVTTEAAAVYYIEKHRLYNLKSVGSSDVVWHLRFAVRKDWPELINIIQRAVDEIPSPKKESLIQRWLKLDYPKQLLQSQWVQMILVLVVMLLLMSSIILNGMLYKQIGRHKRQVAKVNRQLDEAKEQVEELRRVDPLTGIANRRSWLSEANKELARFHRYGQGFSVIFIAVEDYQRLCSEGLKLVAEDRLRQVSLIIAGEVREHDHCGDIGNGHLCLLVQGEDEVRAHQVVERLNARLLEKTQKGDSYDGLVIKVGIASPKISTVSIEELLQQAEAQLYASNSSPE